MSAWALADRPDGGLGCAALRRELRDCCVADKHLPQAKGAPGGGRRRGKRGTRSTCSPPSSPFIALRRREQRTPEPAGESFVSGKSSAERTIINNLNKVPVVAFSDGVCCFCFLLLFWY